MDHVRAQGIDEYTINVHYYYYYKTGSTYKHTNTDIYMLASEGIVTNQKQNEAHSAHAESTHKGVN